MSKIAAFLVESSVFQGLDLHLLSVAKKPDDQVAIAHLNEAEQKVRATGFNPVCQLLHGDPETVIASYVKDKNISLLLMGAYRHNCIRHLVIGSTTAQMLRSSHILCAVVPVKV